MTHNYIDLISEQELVTDLERQPGTKIAHYECASAIDFKGFGWMLHSVNGGPGNAGTWTHGPCHLCGKEMRIVDGTDESVHF